MTLYNIGDNKILLIDDDEPTNFLNKIILNEFVQDKTIQVFELATRALDYLTERLDDDALLPDLIFLDINMPGMDGWEFLEALEKINSGRLKNTKIVMLTTSADPRDLEKSTKHKLVDGFIRKPLTREDVLSRIKNIA